MLGHVHCFYFLKSLIARCLGFQGCHMVIRKNCVWIYIYITPTPHPPLLQNISLFIRIRCKMRSWSIMFPVYLSSVFVFLKNFNHFFFLYFRSGKLLEQMKRQFGTRFKKINNLTRNLHVNNCRLTLSNVFPSVCLIKYLLPLPFTSRLW